MSICRYPHLVILLQFPQVVTGDEAFDLAGVQLEEAVVQIPQPHHHTATQDRELHYITLHLDDAFIQSD